jgi:hypothetical protein
VLVPAILFSLVAVIVRSTLLTQLRDIHGFLSGFSPHGIMSSPFTAVRTVADLAFGLGSHADNGSSEVAKRTQFFWVRSKDLEGHSCFFGTFQSTRLPPCQSTAVRSLSSVTSIMRSPGMVTIFPSTRCQCVEFPATQTRIVLSARSALASAANLS